MRRDRRESLNGPTAAMLHGTRAAATLGAGVNGAPAARIETRAIGSRCHATRNAGDLHRV